MISETTNVTVSASTVCCVIRRNGFTRKKLMQITKLRSTFYTGNFMAQLLQYSRNFFVWIDETSTDRRDQLRKYGYSFQVHDGIIQAIEDSLPIIHSAFRSVSKLQCEGWIAHCGYS